MRQIGSSSVLGVVGLVVGGYLMAKETGELPGALRWREGWFGTAAAAHRLSRHRLSQHQLEAAIGPASAGSIQSGL